MLRNQHLFRKKLIEEYPTLDAAENNPNIEHGFLQYVNDAAFGDFKDLLVDVGINNDSIPFNNMAIENRPANIED